MKILTPLFLLAAGAVATAQNRADQVERNYGFQWAIGTQDAGKAKTWEGGDLRAPGVEAGNKRHPGPARTEDVRCTLNAKLEPVLQEWLRGALDGEAPARDIHLVELIRNGTPSKTTLYSASKVTEIVIPACNGDDLDVESLVTLKFAPGSVLALAQAPAISAAPSPVSAGGKEMRHKAFTHQFKFAVDGLDGQDVVKVASITVRIRPGSAPQVSNLVLTMLEHPGSFAGWKAWFDSFVVQGNNADAQEKSGTLELGARGEVPHLTVALKGLGILRMSRGLAAEGNAGAAVRHEIELYCEGMSILTAGAPSPAAAVAGKPRELPLERAFQKPAAAAANAADQGTRDPEGAPRYPESVRTTFTANRSKISNDERADYVTRSAPEKVEAWFIEEMRKLQWKEGARTESGSVKDASFKIDARWEQEKRSLRLLLGLAKDGSTTLSVQVLTPVK